MLPKSKRLNLKKSFKWAIGGKRLETHSLKIYARIGDNPHPLIGISVPTKIFKQANERNKAKRIIYKAVEFIYSDLRNNLNLVIMPKPGFLEDLESLKVEFINVKDSFPIN